MSQLPDTVGCVLVARGDEILTRTARGLANTATGTRLTIDTRFQIASVSKQFTAAAALLEVDGGRLSLTDRVVDLIPGCPQSWREINVHHLLCHGSGLGHWNDYPEIDLTRSQSRNEVLEAFQQRDPVSAPGERFYYSSPGYWLLADIVERVSGEPYREYLRDNIFAPLGMSATFAGQQRDAPKCATGHRDEAPTLSFELAAVNIGAGDVWSTVDDMWRWNRAVPAEEILSAESWLRTFTVHTRGTKEYGYGWMIGSIGGERVAWHTGGNAGFSCFNVWLRDRDASAVLLSNHEETVSTRERAEALLEPLVALASGH